MEQEDTYGLACCQSGTTRQSQRLLGAAFINPKVGIRLRESSPPLGGGPLAGVPLPAWGSTLARAGLGPCLWVVD